MSGPQPDEPNYLVLIAPGAASDDPTPAWVDVSAYLRSVMITRGADKHLDQDQPGTATIVLDNWGGTWDNDNTQSPYAGLLVTDMRLRVLAEWDGDLYERFNGYLDDIDLEYPDDGEAWAVLRATDAFKVLAGAGLAVSVYAAEVATDDPVHWWRFDEPAGSATAFDAGSDPVDGTWAGPTLGGDTAPVRDPGGSAAFDGVDDYVSFGSRAVVGAFPYTFEVWLKISDRSGVTGQFFFVTQQADVGTGIGEPSGFVFGNDLGSPGILQWDGIQSLGRVDDGAWHHVVLTAAGAGAGQQTLWIDGVSQGTGTATALSAPSPDLILGYQRAAFTALSHKFWPGSIDEFAIYATALPAARVQAHNETGRTPWDGDTPAQRAGRILDLIGWPAVLRHLDTGASTLQATDLGGTALDHLLKVAASEFGDLHVTREGAVRLVARHALINRDEIADFGPAAGAARYRGIRFSSGADLVRNPVTVSREGGVAQTAEAARTYYPHQFTVDGLLHDSDVLSRSAAEFLLSEFKDQKRRIAGLTFGPFDAERLADWFPLLLDAELGDVYRATFTPPNGDDLVQVSVLEGTSESWAADTGIGEMSWSLSRAYAGGGAFWQLGVAGRSELGVTTRLYF